MDITNLSDENAETFLDFFGNAQSEAGETLDYKFRNETAAVFTTLADGIELPLVLAIRLDQRKKFYDGWRFQQTIANQPPLDVAAHIAKRRLENEERRAQKEITESKQRAFAERLNALHGMTVEQLTALAAEYEKIH